MAFVRRSSVLVCAPIVFLAGCAYVRPPMPPTLGIPQKVTVLGALERGDQILIDFTAPAETTDRAKLKQFGDIDLRIGPEGPNWEAKSQKIEVPTDEPGVVHVKTPAAPWIGQTVGIRVLLQGKHRRYGAWSDPIHFKVVQPLLRPKLTAERVREGVRLSWTASEGAEYRLYRLAPGEPRPSVVATVKTPEHVDSQTVYGKTYEYSVQAFIATGNSEAQSDMSEAVPVTPEDIFPPAVPAGLAALAGVSSIELSWNPDTDTDLRGYYVFRSVNGGAFERIGALLETPSYSDHAIEGGKSYRYQVSAVDLRGNESARSAIVEIVAQ